MPSSSETACRGGDQYSIRWNQPDTLLAGNIVTDCAAYAFLNVDIGGNGYFHNSVVQYNTMVGCGAYKVNPSEDYAAWTDPVFTSAPDPGVAGGAHCTSRANPHQPRPQVQAGSGEDAGPIHREGVDLRG